MSSEESFSESPSSSHRSEESDGLTADLARMEAESAKDQEAGSPSPAPAAASSTSAWFTTDASDISARARVPQLRRAPKQAS